MFRSATLAAFIALSVSAPAWAQGPDVSAEGAAAMRAAIADGLKRYFPNGEEDGTEFRWAGEPQVTPAGDRYDVALPALTVVTDEDTHFDVGTIQLKVVPKPDSAYAVEATLPASMTMRNGDTPSGTLTIGSQRFTGVWSAAVENFMSADLAYGDLALVGDDDGALRIASFTATQDMRSDGPGTWGGPVAAALSDVTLTDAQKTSLLKVANIAMEATYGRIDLAKMAQFRTLAATHSAAGTEPSAAQILPLLGGMLGEAVMRTRITGLSAGNDEGRVAFDLATFTLGVHDLDRDTSTTVLGFKGDGLKIEPLPGPKQFMPERFDVQLSLGKLPNAAVGQAAVALAALEEQKKAHGDAEEGKASPGNPKGRKIESEDDADDAMASAIGNVVMEAASRAGTELRIDHLSLDTPATSGSETGAARVASAAAFGAVGGANVVLRGLDAATNALKPKPGTKPDSETQQTLGMVEMLKAMGQQGKDAAGNDVRTYKIDLTESGQILLNGADMSAMMGMGAAPTEPAPQPKRGSKKD